MSCYEGSGDCHKPRENCFFGYCSELLPRYEVVQNESQKILADSGYQGIMKMYSQAQTPRKSSKLKPLTLEDKTYNHTLSKERIKVENIFAKVKTFKIFSTTYRNRRKRFGLRMNLIAGMINRELGF